MLETYEVETCSINSKNIPKGTIVVKEITSVDKTLIKNIFVRGLLTSIINKFPKDRKEIIIQFDNSSPHIKDDDVDWRESVEEIGIKLKIKHHTYNSPDLNVLDLGYFNDVHYLE